METDFKSFKSFLNFITRDSVGGQFLTLLCGVLLFVVYEYYGAATPINTTSDHVTLDKVGWTPDYSLHPIQWNCSGMEVVQPPLGPVRQKASKSRPF